MDRQKLREMFIRTRQRIEAEKKKEEEAKRLRELKKAGLPLPPKPPAAVKQVPVADPKVFECFDDGPKSLKELMAITGYSKVTLRNSLVRLTIRGLIEQGPCVEKSPDLEDKRGRRQFTYRKVEPTGETP